MTAMLPLYTIVVLLIAGLAVGALTGITGSSGVVVVVPVLSTIGLSFQDSVGSSLLVDVITTSVVIYVYLKHGNASVKNGISMGLGALLGAQMGTRLAISLPQGP
ncbi:MAG: TSUP family transporter, partial [Candidatus Marsarchaeota archaeon]